MKSPSEPHACTCRGDEYLTVNGQFWCQRHQVWKTQHYHQLCQARPGYWRMWEEGRGPGQPVKPRETPAQPRPALGPGGTLRKLLGCSAKQWPYYADMDEWGEACQEHLEELVTKLVAFQCSSCGSEDAARRVITLALEKWRLRTGGDGHNLP